MLRVSRFFLLLLFLPIVVSCGSGDSNTTNVSSVVDAASALMVVDYQGREVVLDYPATRIVALSPHIVENLFSAGAGQHIVAAVAFSDYPEGAKVIRQLGNAGSVGLEAIVSVDPDLVVVWGSGDQNSAMLVRRLEQLSIPVYVDEPRKLEDVARSIVDLGKLAGTEEKALSISEGYLDALSVVRQRHQNKAPVSVFYQIWDSPLQTLNGDHMISDMIALCGGSNIFADSSVLAPQVSVESVLHRNPDLIFASATTELAQSWLRAWEQWSALNAVEKNALYSLEPDWMSRQTVRLLLGLQQMCEAIDSERSL